MGPELFETASPLRELAVEYRLVSDLRPYPRNARTHSRKQLRQIADSIQEFGFTNPLLIDGDDMIIAGHGRVEAAKLLKLPSVPCIRIEHMNEAQKKAYVLADNKLALNAGWDEEILATELQFLLEADVSFDVGVIGFETAEIDLLVEGLDPEESGDPDDDVIPEVDTSATPITQLGDLWLLGPHRLLCGDATKPDTFERLMDGGTAQMVFTDPPYNVPVDGHVCGLGAIKHREFAMASGEMSEAEFVAFLNTVFGHLAAHSIDGAINYISIDWRHMGEMLSASAAVYGEIKNLCVWVKDNGGMGIFYRSRHELVFAFKVGIAPHINTFELGQHGRYRTNVWQYRGVNTLRKGRIDELELHPTVKPVAMVADAIKDVSQRGGTVLDCFGGSGTMLIAAHKTARRARVMELDPVYVDTAIRRWQVFAKDDAIHAESGLSFTEMAANAEAQVVHTKTEAQINECA
jgi:DNA modification methylase